MIKRYQRGPYGTTSGRIMIHDMHYLEKNFGKKKQNEKGIKPLFQKQNYFFGQLFFQILSFTLQSKSTELQVFE